MNSESQWDSTRWRDAEQASQNGQWQQPAGMATVTQAPRSGVHDHAAQSAHGKHRDDVQFYSTDARRSSQFNAGLSSNHAQPGRHTLSGTYGPQDPPSFADSVNYTGIWRNASHDEYHSGERPAVDAALSVQIPNKAQELPGISHGYSTPRSEVQLHSGSTGSWSHQTTSLPSFAALSERASRNDEPDEVEIAPMSARLSCSQCMQLTPLVKEVAVAVAELDENVQVLCNKAVTRTLDFPGDNAMRTVRWILDRLSYAKSDAREASRHPLPTSYAESYSSGPRNVSNPLKRRGVPWDHDEEPVAKVARGSAQHEEGAPDSRRVAAASPAPSDSAPGSAYPRQSSPPWNRAPRALPSPLSTAFPLSTAPSHVQANAQSVCSPGGTSYHPASSIHTVSTSSATSAHLADLQHQVSLKSLALQTLQQEYATLLQKLQRERIKSQAIEKKTSVAEQEVNELTTRNEELTEQISGLEKQVQDCEQKREEERAGATREKEQWGRMLEMSGRIQSKTAEAKQKLADENAVLLQRLGAHEGEYTRRPEQSRVGFESGSSETNRTSTSNATPADKSVEASLAMSAGSKDSISIDMQCLRRDNAALRSRNEQLTSALAEARRQDRMLSTKVQEVLQSSGIQNTIDKVLPPDNLDSRTTAREELTREKSTLQEPRHEAPKIPAAAAPEGRGTLQRQPIPAKAAAPVQRRGHDFGSSMSLENIASIARAVSPGPAELGFHVEPSTSSPEELIQALGPVPSPVPSLQSASTPARFRGQPSSSARHRRRESQPLVAPIDFIDTEQPSQGHVARSNQTHGSGLTGSSPRSYQSSPGPLASNNSSPDSAYNRSPERHSGRTDYARRHSQPYLPSAAVSSASAMPPPPRPLS